MRTGRFDASGVNQQLKRDFALGIAVAVARSARRRPSPWGRLPTAATERVLLKLRAEITRNELRSARNHVSMTCTIRKAWSSPALGGRFQLSFALRCCQTECPATGSRRDCILSATLPTGPCRAVASRSVQRTFRRPRCSPVYRSGRQQAHPNGSYSPARTLRRSTVR